MNVAVLQTRMLLKWVVVLAFICSATRVVATTAEHTSSRPLNTALAERAPDNNTTLLQQRQQPATVSFLNGGNANHPLTTASLNGVDMAKMEPADFIGLMEQRLFMSRNNFTQHDIFATFLGLLKAHSATHSSNTSEPKESQIAFHKTHKTGSSTLASVFYRFACRHNLKIFTYGHGTVFPFLRQWTINLPPNQREAYNISIQHVWGRSGPPPQPVPRLMSFYRSIIKSPKVITIVREPISHAISWVCYMYAPKTMEELELLISKKLPANILATEFAVATPFGADKFLGTEINNFSLVCLAEAFDECVVMMRRQLNWDLEDITYLRLLDSVHREDTLTRYDGKKVMKTPSLLELSPHIQTILHTRTKVDKIIYQGVAKRWQSLVKKAGDDFHKEVIAFQELQAEFKHVCDSSPHHPTCEWYRLEDHEFIRLASYGYMKPVSFSLRS